MLNNSKLKSDLKNILKDDKTKGFLVTFDGFILDIKSSKIKISEDEKIKKLLKNLQKYFEHEIPKNKTWKLFNNELKENFFLRIIIEFLKLNQTKKGGIFSGWFAGDTKFSSIKSKHIYDESYEDFTPTADDVLTQDEEYEKDSKEIIKTIEEFSHDYKLFDDHVEADEHAENQSEFYLNVQYDKNKEGEEDKNVEKINLFIDLFDEVVNRHMDSDILTHGAKLIQSDVSKIAYALRDLVKKSIPEEYHKFLKVNISNISEGILVWLKSKKKIAKSYLKAESTLEEEVIISFLLELTHIHRNLEDYNFVEEDKVKIFIENFYEFLRHEYGVPIRKISDYFYLNKGDKSKIQGHQFLDKDYHEVLSNAYAKIKKSIIDKYSYLLQDHEEQIILEDLKTVYLKLKKLRNIYENILKDIRLIDRVKDNKEKILENSSDNSSKSWISRALAPEDAYQSRSEDTVLLIIIVELKKLVLQKIKSDNIHILFDLLQTEFGVGKNKSEMGIKKNLDKYYFNAKFIDFYEQRPNLGSDIELSTILKKLMTFSQLSKNPTKIIIIDQKEDGKLQQSYVPIDSKFSMLFDFTKLINRNSIIEIKKLLDEFLKMLKKEYNFDRILTTFRNMNSLENNEKKVETIFNVLLSFRNWLDGFLKKHGFYSEYQIGDLSQLSSTDIEKRQRQIQQVRKAKFSEDDLFYTISNSIRDLSDSNLKLRQMNALFQKDIKDLEEGGGGNFKNYSSIFINPIKNKLRKNEQLTYEELSIIDIIEKTKPFLQSIEWSKVKGPGAPINFDYYKDIRSPFRPPTSK